MKAGVVRRDFLRSSVLASAGLGLAGAASGATVREEGRSAERGATATRKGEGMRFVQPLRGAAEELFAYAETIPTIDCHEHIPEVEELYNKAGMSGFGALFIPYLTNDLNSAGMKLPEGGPSVAFTNISDDWDAFGPYWTACKFTSYARPIRLTLQKFYGVDDLTRENYMEITKRAMANNTPGIYQRIFRDTCGIEKVIVNCFGLPKAGDTLLVVNLASPSMMTMSKDTIVGIAGQIGAPDPATLDEYAAITDTWMEKKVKEGAVEFKTQSILCETPDKAKAEEAFKLVLEGKPMPPDMASNLSAILREAHARKAAQLDVPIAIHTGVWGDYRMVAVENIISFVQRNPKTRIDVYHLGIPSPRAALQLVKNFPNAYLNLCWTHIVAPDMTVNSLKEAMDMVPLNKVFAFGGDFVTFVEEVYGHLHMARENIAIVFGDRVDRNLMDMDEAKHWIKAWFYDNPKAFYRL